MRLDQIIKRIDKLSQLEKLVIIGRIANQLDLKCEWLSNEEILKKRRKEKKVI